MKSSKTPLPMVTAVPDEQYYQLINIFMAVADAVDGDKRVLKDIKQAYEDAMETDEILQLYTDLQFKA